MGEEVEWEKLRPKEIEKRFSNCPIVYLPFGTLEWHGYQNPLGLDSIKARKLCKLAAERSGGIVAPTTTWAIEGVPHPWTTSMPKSLIRELALNIFNQMSHIGFDIVIALTGHYAIDQVITIKSAALDAMRKSNLSIYAAPEYELVSDKGYRGEHAAKWETSIAKALFPNLVNMDEAQKEKQPLYGVYGEDPRTHSSRELGEEITEAITERLAKIANRLLKNKHSKHRFHFIEAAYYHLETMKNLGYRAYSMSVYWEGIEAIRGGDYQNAIDAFFKTHEKKDLPKPNTRPPEPVPLD